MRSALLLSALVLCAGCAGSVRQTYTKPAASDMVVTHDERQLERARGVRDAIITRDATGTATLQLFIKETDKTPGMTKALELGYTRVTD
jgi:hypothetical protein